MGKASLPLAVVRPDKASGRMAGACGGSNLGPLGPNPELLRISRGGWRDGKGDASAAAAGGVTGSNATRDGAETPLSAADSVPRSELEADAMGHFSD